MSFLTSFGEKQRLWWGKRISTPQLQKTLNHLLWGTPPLILRLLLPENKGLLWRPETQEWQQVSQEQLSQILPQKRLIIAIDGGEIVKKAHASRKRVFSFGQQQMRRLTDDVYPCVWMHQEQAYIVSTWDLVSGWYVNLPVAVQIVSVTLWGMEVLAQQFQSQKEKKKDGFFQLTTGDGRYCLTVQQGMPIAYRRLPTQVAFPEDKTAISCRSREDSTDVAVALSQSGSLICGWSSWVTSYGHFLHLMQRHMLKTNVFIASIAALCMLLWTSSAFLQGSILSAKEELVTRVYGLQQQHPDILHWPVKDVMLLPRVSAQQALGHVQQKLTELHGSYQTGSLQSVSLFISSQGKITPKIQSRDHQNRGFSEEKQP